jgi:hypothetical protein
LFTGSTTKKYRTPAVIRNVIRPLTKVAHGKLEPATVNVPPLTFSGSFPFALKILSRGSIQAVVNELTSPVKAADHDTDGQVDDIAAQDEVLEALQELEHGGPSGVRLTHRR